MAAQQNVERIRAGYDAFNRGDLAALTDLFAEDAVWHSPGRGPMASEYRGRDATFGCFGRLAQGTDGTFHANLRDLMGDGDTVVGVQSNTATSAGKPLDVNVCVVFRMRDGRIVEGREYNENLYAWDEFWS